MRLERSTSVGLALLASLACPAAAWAGGVPWFARVTPDPLAPQACGGDGCWTNYVRVTDLNGDDALDLVFVNYAGLFINGTAQPLIIYENDGDAGFTNVSDVAVNDYVGRIRQVAIGDVDGDGDPDMYVPSARAEGDAFFINDGMGVFTDEVDDRLPGLNSRAGAARFFDADNDGDFDLFLSDGYITNSVVFGHLYLNDGDGNFTELGGAMPAVFDGVDIDDVDVFDADRDFDLDLLVNAHNGNSSLWINDGAGMFSDASDDLPNSVTANNHYNPAVCDVDDDGDLDIWIDNIGGNFQEQLMINDGTGAFTDETNARVTGNVSSDDNGIGCVDLDNDGDFDAVVYALSTPERAFINDGNGNFSAMAGVFPATTDSTLWGEFGDLDGDGRIDLVTGQGEGTELEAIDLGTASLAVDDRAPEITHYESPEAMEPGDTELVLRYAVRDRVVTDEGARLSAAFARYTVDGGTMQTADALFMGGDLYRVAIPGQSPGSTVSVELCATDRAGNEGCVSAGTYQVGDVPPTTGTDGTGSGTDSSTTDTASTSGSGSDSASASASDSGTSASSGGSGTDGDTDAATAGEGGDDSGCSCRTQGQPTPGVLWFLGLLGLAGTGRRVRNRRR